MAHQPHQRGHRGRGRRGDDAHPGDANVDQILTDIGNLAAAIPSAASQGFDPSQLGAASGAVTDASIDVYSGVDDHVLRKLDANLTIDPSAIAGGAMIPVSNIQISFSVEIDGLNEDADDLGARRREADQLSCSATSA